MDVKKKKAQRREVAPCPLLYTEAREKIRIFLEYTRRAKLGVDAIRFAATTYPKRQAIHDSGSNLEMRLYARAPVPQYTIEGLRLLVEYIKSKRVWYNSTSGVPEPPDFLIGFDLWSDLENPVAYSSRKLESQLLTWEFTVLAILEWDVAWFDDRKLPKRT